MVWNELLKIKRNPTGLALLALGFFFPTAVFLADRLAGDRVEITSTIQPWLQAPVVIVALLGAYLLTLEPAFGTGKWIFTTPVTPPRLAAAKALTTALLALLSFLFAVGLAGELPAGRELGLGALALFSSLLTITWLSGLLRHFAGVLVLGMVWMQAAPWLLKLLPQDVQPWVWSVLPGLGLTHFEDADHNAARIVAHLFYLLLAWAVWRRGGAR